MHIGNCAENHETPENQTYEHLVHRTDDTQSINFPDKLPEQMVKQFRKKEFTHKSADMKHGPNVFQRMNRQMAQWLSVAPGCCAEDRDTGYHSTQL